MRKKKMNKDIDVVSGFIIPINSKMQGACIFGFHDYCFQERIKKGGSLEDWGVFYCPKCDSIKFKKPVFKNSLKVTYKNSLYWIIPLTLFIGMIGMFFGLFVAQAGSNNVSQEIFNYCLDNQYQRFDTLDIDVDLKFAQLQDDKWYWCEQINNGSVHTYAFYDPEHNATYGTHISFK